MKGLGTQGGGASTNNWCQHKAYTLTCLLPCRDTKIHSHWQFFCVFFFFFSVLVQSTFITIAQQSFNSRNHLYTANRVFSKITGCYNDTSHRCCSSVQNKNKQGNKSQKSTRMFWKSAHLRVWTFNSLHSTHGTFSELDLVCSQLEQRRRLSIRSLQALSCLESEEEKHPYSCAPGTPPLNNEHHPHKELCGERHYARFEDCSRQKRQCKWKNRLEHNFISTDCTQRERKMLVYKRSNK